MWIGVSTSEPKWYWWSKEPACNAGTLRDTGSILGQEDHQCRKWNRPVLLPRNPRTEMQVSYTLQSCKRWTWLKTLNTDTNRRWVMDETFRKNRKSSQGDLKHNTLWHPLIQVKSHIFKNMIFLFIFKYLFCYWLHWSLSCNMWAL